MNRQLGVEGSLARILDRHHRNPQPPQETFMPGQYLRQGRCELATVDDVAACCDRITMLAATIRARAVGEPDPYFTGGQPLVLIADLGSLVADLTAYTLRAAMQPHLHAPEVQG